MESININTIPNKKNKERVMFGDAEERSKKNSFLTAYVMG